MSLGILVYGDNHLILRGPRPTRTEARALAAHFGLSLAQISPRIDQPGHYRDWRISVREFREDIQWAVRLLASTQPSTAVSQLLAELDGRGVPIDRIEESACVVS